MKNAHNNQTKERNKVCDLQNSEYVIKYIDICVYAKTQKKRRETPTTLRIGYFSSAVCLS